MTKSRSDLDAANVAFMTDLRLRRLHGRMQVVPDITESAERVRRIIDDSHYRRGIVNVYKYSDAQRLRFLMRDIDGVRGIEKDRHEYASQVADLEGHTEPTPTDELDGFRMLIDAAIDAGV